MHQRSLVWLLWPILMRKANLGQFFANFWPKFAPKSLFMQISYVMPSTKWKSELFWLCRPHMTGLKVNLYVAHSPGGFLSLASTDARQHPLFLASIHCTRLKLIGPGFNSYPVIISFSFVPCDESALNLLYTVYLDIFEELGIVWSSFLSFCVLRLFPYWFCQPIHILFFCILWSKRNTQTHKI